MKMVLALNSHACYLSKHTLSVPSTESKKVEKTSNEKKNVHMRLTATTISQHLILLNCKLQVRIEST